MVKVDIITGFLGAGKTTFILKLIEAFSKTDKKIVIIENEFGKIGIDGKLINNNGIPVYEISNGCVCCNLKGDFQFALANIIDTLKPDHIIIEPSGIFIMDNFHDIIKGNEKRFILNSCISIVDCVSFTQQRHKYSMFFESQIKSCTRIVLSKIQCVSEYKSIISELKSINPNALITATNWSDLEDATTLLGNGVKSCNLHNKGKARHGFDTFSMEVNKKINYNELEDLLNLIKKGYYGDIIRMKGILETENGIIEFQYTNGFYNITNSSDLNVFAFNAVGISILKDQLYNFFS